MSKKAFKQRIVLPNLVGEKTVRLNFSLMLWSMALLSVGVIPLDYYLKNKLSHLETGVKTLASQIPELREKIKKERFAHPASDPLVALYAKTKALEDASPSFAKEFEALIRNHQEGLWITQLSFNRQTHQGQITGYALDPAIIHHYFDKMNESKEFDDYNLTLLTIKEESYGTSEKDLKKTDKKEQTKGKAKEDSQNESKTLQTYQFTLSTKTGGA